MSEPWFYTRQMLTEHGGYIRGRTLDLGAGREKYKRIIEGCCDKYISLDAFTNVDVVGDALSIPFRESVFDTVICTEVIEHVSKPWVVVHESNRVLKEGGHFLLSTPFLYPYHPEPKDYFRYTSEGLRALLEDACFTVVAIQSMGGEKLVFVEYLGRMMKDTRFKRGLMCGLYWLIARLEPKGSERLNTPNHFVVARKSAVPHRGHVST